MDNIEIRRLTEWDELRPFAALQRVVWGDDPEVLVPQHMLASITRSGGLVLGAYDGAELIGGVIAFLGTDSGDQRRPAMANLKLFSKRTAVLPAYRDQGIGYRLKMAQRMFARQLGIRLITWTFDPLLSRNAYLNLRKLGTTVTTFYENYLGTDLEGLVLAGASDRLLAEWWVTSRRVEARINESRPPLTLDQYLSGGITVINPTALNDAGLPMPSDEIIQPPTMMALVEIPVDFRQIVADDAELALVWRAHSRLAIRTVLDMGFMMTDFVHAPYEGRPRSFYVCSDAGALQQFSQN